jgi:hypothetical protein
VAVHRLAQYPWLHMRGFVRRSAALGVTALGVAALGVIASPAVAYAQPAEVYPVSKVQRGQTGYGLTTFAGTKPERFTFEVVSVVRNFLPKQDIILVKSDDPKLAVSGFWQGMSGSPLFLENAHTSLSSRNSGLPDMPCQNPETASLGSSDLTRMMSCLGRKFRTTETTSNVKRSGLVPANVVRP